MGGSEVRQVPPARPRDLVRALGRTQRRRNLRALVLIAPLLIFLLLNFVAPIGFMLARSVQEVEVPEVWPRTAAALRDWDGSGLPDQSVIAQLTNELEQSYSGGRLSAAANRLNYDTAGFRTLLFSTARALPAATGVTALDRLMKIDARWGPTSRSTGAWPRRSVSFCSPSRCCW